MGLGDIGERVDIAAANPAIVRQMQDRLAEHRLTYSEHPAYPASTVAAYCAEAEKHGRWVGPWVGPSGERCDVLWFTYNRCSTKFLLSKRELPPPPSPPTHTHSTNSRRFSAKVPL